MGVATPPAAAADPNEETDSDTEEDETDSEESDSKWIRYTGPEEEEAPPEEPPRALFPVTPYPDPAPEPIPVPPAEEDEDTGPSSAMVGLVIGSVGALAIGGAILSDGIDLREDTLEDAEDYGWDNLSVREQMLETNLKLAFGWGLTAVGGIGLVAGLALGTRGSPTHAPAGLVYRGSF